MCLVLVTCGVNPNHAWQRHKVSSPVTGTASAENANTLVCGTLVEKRMLGYASSTIVELRCQESLSSMKNHGLCFQTIPITYSVVVASESATKRMR
jgi:hypothetical protein